MPIGWGALISRRRKWRRAARRCPVGNQQRSLRSFHRSQELFGQRCRVGPGRVRATYQGCHHRAPLRQCPRRPYNSAEDHGVLREHHRLPTRMIAHELPATAVLSSHHPLHQHPFRRPPHDDLPVPPPRPAAVDQDRTPHRARRSRISSPVPFQIAVSFHWPERQDRIRWSLVLERGFSMPLQRKRKGQFPNRRTKSRSTSCLSKTMQREWQSRKPPERRRNHRRTAMTTRIYPPAALVSVTAFRSACIQRPKIMEQFFG